MLIHPWDAAVDEQEWRGWLEHTDRFGVLAVNHRDPGAAPFVLPTHFSLVGGEILMHLARPNPVWEHLAAATEVRLAMIGDWAFIPGTWRAKRDIPPDEGIPTSYYTSVQFVCRPTIVDDAEGKVSILTARMDDLQSEGYATIAAEGSPFSSMLPGIRGIRLQILRVEAKFKFDDHKPVEHRVRVTEDLLARGHGSDRSAALQQERRLKLIGDWDRRRQEG